MRSNFYFYFSMPLFSGGLKRSGQMEPFGVKHLSDSVCFASVMCFFISQSRCTCSPFHIKFRIKCFCIFLINFNIDGSPEQSYSHRGNQCLIIISAFNQLWSTKDITFIIPLTVLTYIFAILTIFLHFFTVRDNSYFKIKIIIQHIVNKYITTVNITTKKNNCIDFGLIKIQKDCL